MAGIGLTFSELMETSGRIMNLKNTFNETMELLRGEVLKTEGTFKGSAAGAFRAKLEDFVPIMRNFTQEIEQYSNNLKQYANTIHDIDINTKF